MTDKFFSVTVQLEDATSKVLPMRAASSGDAFRAARETAGVRRVGRVAEITEAAFVGLGEGRVVEPTVNARPESQKVAEPESRPHVAHVISGPRTVVYAPPTGGEQPFKHLKAPPERPKPIVEVKPEPVKKAAPAATEVSPSMRMPQVSAATEYRIVKSRRRDGLPYLVQRGNWQEASGRRTFHVEWEKCFATREEAVKHLDWIEHNERELAALQSA
jgi:outer membrane biosynthesis protein TonB